jgi:C-terminal processing protease CtpA/Prc
VLVNGGTSGAAEALAASLREVNAGLILGSRTAGRASVTKDFPLKNGEMLHIATTPVALGDGASLPSQGIKPDIDVTVSVQDEKSFYADAFLLKTNNMSGLSSTNQPGGTNQVARRLRFNEAELVRARKQGIDLDAMEEEGFLPLDKRPEMPVVRDPALARALDLLKGLAVVRQSHS